ncbi:MAG: polysaccharide biosynthesis tyrosine autokinase [Acidimicrobiia bacterium]|nr:polysaccharide biosynthesis tyrosine autokinase [Acidimicrobiia bacterium]
MSPSDNELLLSDYLDVISRRKWMLLAVLTLSLGAAIAFSALQTPMYRAEARVRVEVSNSSSNNILVDGNNLSSNVRNRNLQNEVEFAKSDRVALRASEIIGDLPSATIGASTDSDTLIFGATSASPDEAALIANTFADAYVSERSVASGERFIAAVEVINSRLIAITTSRLELQSELAASTDSSGLQIQIDSLSNEEVRLRAQLNEIDVISRLDDGAVTVLNAASSPASPFSPSWARNLALATIAGIVLGMGVALLLETLDDTILSKRDLEEAADGVPVLGLVPSPHKRRFRSRPERQLVTTRTGLFTEAFRSLRSAIELGQAADSEIRSILVTSSNAAEGKSTVVAHLGIAFARSGASVLVIDADMHNPTQHELFGIANRNGLAEELANVDNAEIITEQASGEGLLSVIPAGATGSAPAELLRSEQAQEFIEKLSYAYDLVIIDSPPLLPIADTLSLARICDATLLVSMRGRTNAAEAQEAVELLARAKTRPLGTVLNGAEENDNRYGHPYGKGRR